MKLITAIFCLCLLSWNAWSQENSVAVYGGYSFGTGSVTDAKQTGWKFNAVYEFNPGGGNWSIGGSVGYISLAGTEVNPLTSQSFKVQAVPICLVPKFSFGSEKFKGHLRGAIGSGITTITYSGPLVTNASDTQWGMSFGFGAGVTYFANERVFLVADYEWLRLTNNFNDSGSINSATAGIGMKF